MTFTPVSSRLRQLPLELWSLVLSHLWRRDLRVCLFVSRTLHALALARLFRVVQLHFSVRGFSPDDDISLELEAAQTTRAAEILGAIISDKGGPFANAVRKIVVHTARARHECVMERMVLISALAALPHLLEFAWIGFFPPLQQDVADALAIFCPRLTHLYVEDEEWIMTKRHSMPGLVHFDLTHLTSISVVSKDMQPSAMFYTDAFEALVVANMDSLRSLATDGDRIRHLPVRSFARLQHLEIRRIDFHGASVQLMLCHCPQLESLALLDFYDSDIAVVVAGTCGRLPNLRSFALLTIETDEYKGVLLDFAHTLISFLGTILNLRRLRLCIPDTYEYPGVAGLAIKHLLSGIAQHCPHLEAFGLEFGNSYDMPAFEALAGMLPLSLQAVSLSLVGLSSAPDSTRITPRPLLDRLAQLPHLAFLYIDWGCMYALRLSPEELVRDMHALQLIIVGGQASAWDVYRASEPNGETTLEQWPSRTLEYRCVEDFPCGTEDGEWLLRHAPGLS